jgi:hypothetical protein
MKLRPICLAVAITYALFGCKPASNTGENQENLREDGMEEAMVQQFKMQRDPALNRIPAERLEIARQQMEMRMAARGQQIQALTWVERGPDNISGRTRAIFVDSRDATGNTVFAASVSGGIFKTTNFNTSATWTPINDQMSNLAVTALVQSGVNANIMYAGTGEGYFNVDAVRGAGVFKSIDGGVTWTKLPSTSNWEYVQDMAVDLSGNVYATLRSAATTNRGVYRSADGGTSWVQVLGTSVSISPSTRGGDLEVASNGDVYATYGIFTRSQVFKSAANGVATGMLGSWLDITPVHTIVTQRAELAIAPSNPQRLYLIMQDSATDQVSYLYRSFNAGTTWDSLPAPAAVNNGAFSQNWYNLIAGVDPTNPDVVVIGGYHVARSSDAGANWTNITAPSGVHVDQHVLLYATANRLIVGNDGGIYSTDNATNANPSFSKKSTGFNVTQFYGVDIHPLQTDYFLAGAQDNNTQKFTSAGLNSTSAVVGGDGGFPHIRQTDGFLQIAATTGNNYYRSLNSGATWSTMSTVNNNRGQFINPTDLADNQNILYASDDPGRYYVISNLETTPTGLPVFVGAIGNNREVTAVKVDPFTPHVVWLGTTSLVGGVIPNIVKLGNANTNSPVVLASSTLAVPAGAYISSIDVDPNNANHAIATVSNYGVSSVFETTNGGTSWTSIEGDLPDMPVYWGIFAPANAVLNGTGNPEGGIILGTEMGVWTTSAIGGPFSPTQWIPNNAGFPNVRTDMIRYRSSDRLLLAATHGRGLFSTTIPQGTSTVGVSNIAATKDFIKYVSAVNNRLMIVPGTLNTKKIDVQVFDLSGRLVYQRAGAYQSTTISTSSWSRGSYVVKIRGDKNEQYAKQFVKE